MGYWCTKCDEYAYGSGHKCPPQWDVWEVRDDEDDKATVFASDAEDAATKAVEQWCDRGGDGPMEYEVLVRATGSESDPERYAVGFEYNVTYTATRS